MRTMSRTITFASVLLIAFAVAMLGYRIVRADVHLARYEEQLASLSEEYESLRSTYNDAVRKTAITELHVNKGALCVRVRTHEGVQRTIDTPFDPAGEIYVDYVIQDGRVWIRRLFDAKTAPADALVIDPAYQDVEWADDDANVGKAIYRSLSEGRWVVTVTGDGSLGLAKAEDPSERAELVTAPRIRSYEEILDEADTTLRRVTPADVLRALLGS